VEVDCVLKEKSCVQQRENVVVEVTAPRAKTDDAMPFEVKRNGRSRELIMFGIFNYALYHYC